jgi:hypothetical protein
MKKFILTFALLFGGSSLFADKSIKGATHTDYIWDYNKISVCWNGSAINLPERDISIRRSWVRDQVEATWEAHSNIDFIGWEECDAVGGADIHMSVKDDNPGVAGGLFGKQLKNRGVGVAFNFTFNNWSTNCQGDEERCIRNIATHEFGHILGLRHEHERADRTQDCEDYLIRNRRNTDTLSDDFLLIGVFDENSTMNYCNPNWNNNGLLSKGDIEAVQEMYGNIPKRKSTDVGVIPNTRSCPSTTHETNEIVKVFMDNENGGNSFSGGWTGAFSITSKYKNAFFNFCRVEGDKFFDLDTKEPYAVLKLGTECPNNSKEVLKIFTNEAYKNYSYITDNSFPNFTFKVEDPNRENFYYAGTAFYFCLFDGSSSENMENFPSFNDINVDFKYGVLSSLSFSKALSTGFVVIDNEDTKKYRDLALDIQTEGSSLTDDNTEDFSLNKRIFFNTSVGDSPDFSDDTIITRRVKSLDTKNSSFMEDIDNTDTVELYLLQVR